ncbi:hypothetical protein FQN57_007420 [Myotisia sp. PD_48]|nr:hypothetical protein FQN57_007420 [Myotisia sp. PD_48]
MTSVPPSNGAAANAIPQTNATAGPRAPSRPTSGLKGNDASRRQSGSPIDGAQRRTPQQKAWNNPNISAQRASGPYTQQNGTASGKKPALPSNPITNKESNTPDLHAHDRLVFILTASIGHTTTITLKNGEKFTGIFSGATLEPNETSFMLKMTQQFIPDSEIGQQNGISHEKSPYIGLAPDHQMIFEVQDLAHLEIPKLTTSGVAAKENNSAASNFRTDSDISGNLPGRERQLQRWEPGGDTAVDLSLESSKTGTWDQFETNARLFGATSSYDENIYTTRIDRSDPSYKQREAEAARIAREIETSDTDNVHVREERGLVAPSEDIDEESKYSGVTRGDATFSPLVSGQPNKYTPPARRPPTTQPNIPGALADPAIVAAQLARPDSQNKSSSQHKSLPTPPVNQNAKSDISKTGTPSYPVMPSKDSVESGAKSTAGNAVQTGAARPGAAENAASNVETEVLDHFRRFANDEKMKLQERRRNQASYDRTIKLNELMKFSKNFKLGTPVPKDLVPILAKDPGKQEEIVERAQKQHEEKLSGLNKKAGTLPTDAKPTGKPSTTSRFEGTNGPPTGGPDRHPYSRPRQGYPPAGPQNGRPAQHQGIHAGRGGSGLLGHRLADIQQQRRGNMAHVSPPPPTTDGRVPPSGPLASDQTFVSGAQKQVQSPTSNPATKFNVRALEFKPNPAANTFTPAGMSAVSSSPASNSRTQSISRATSPSAFFGARVIPSASERPSIRDHFNPFDRLKKEAEEDSSKDYAFNGGIPPAYRTLPTWEVSPINEKKTYADIFKPLTGVQTTPPQIRSASNPQLPHQNQLPYHHPHGAHHGPPNTGPPPTHLVPPQHQHGAPLHFDDHHRMQISSSTSQVYPSPRLQHTPMAYQPSVGPHNQLAMGHGVPPYYVGQGHQQPGPMRHYPNGPHFANTPNGTGAPMMTHQASSGPYMNMPQGMGTPYNPPMQMYSPSPAHVYPQHVQPPGQPNSGYPSPSRGAPMMMHQGSQQGQPPQPVMVMNQGQPGQPYYSPHQPGHMPPLRPGHNQQHPHFSSSPHQTHHYPHHQYRNHNNNFNQLPPMPQPPMPMQVPQQQPASGPPPGDAAEDAK